MTLKRPRTLAEVKLMNSNFEQTHRRIEAFNTGWAFEEAVLEDQIAGKLNFNSSLCHLKI